MLSSSWINNYKKKYIYIYKRKDESIFVHDLIDQDCSAVNHNDVSLIFNNTNFSLIFILLFKPIFVRVVGHYQAYAAA